MKRFIKVFSLLIIALVISGQNKTTVEVSASVNSISLSKYHIEMEMFTTATLKAYISPKNASNQKITWSISDKKVLTLNSKGVITPKKPGYAVIFAKLANGQYATCSVLVTTPEVSYKYKGNYLFTGFNKKFFKEPKIFNCVSEEWHFSKYSVYKKTIKKIFPGGTKNLEDWEIVRNVCFWAVNDYVDNGKNSIFKKEYNLLGKDYLNRLSYSSGLNTTGEIVQKLLGFLEIDVISYYNQYHYPILAVKLDGDWYYCSLWASYDYDNKCFSFGHLFETGEFIKTMYYEDFKDILGANHHEYCNGCKVWYLDNIDYLLTEDGIKEFTTRIEDSKFTVSGKIYIGIGIGIKKENCNDSGPKDFILAKNVNEALDQTLLKYSNLYPDMWYSEDKNNKLTVSEYQLVSGCAKRIGYKILFAASLGGGNEAHKYKGYIYDSSIYSIEPAVALSQYRLNLHIGDTVTLKATDITDKYENKNITWYSSNSSVATVDVNGKVTCLSFGDVDIIAIINNKKSNSCFIQITYEGDD